MPYCANLIIEDAGFEPIVLTQRFWPLSVLFLILEHDLLGEFIYVVLYPSTGECILTDAICLIALKEPNENYRHQNTRIFSMVFGKFLLLIFKIEIHNLASHIMPRNTTFMVPLF